MKKLAVVLFILFFSHYCFGQSDVLKFEPILSVDKVRPGDEFKVGLKIEFFADWHINAHAPNEEYLIPTIVTLDSTDEFKFGRTNYPEAQQKTFEFSETPLAVYDGEIVIWASGMASADLQAGQTKITGTFSYQACNDVQCLMPQQVKFEAGVDVVPAGSPVQQLNSPVFGAGDNLGKLQGERSQNEIGDLIAGKGLLVTFGFIFLGGLLLNLTPCVYPLIPITVSFFVGQSSGKISRSFTLALVYVIGMSVTYSALGVVAAMTGGLLGSSLQNPAVLIAIAAIFLVFAFSMFGAFEIRMPTFLNNLAGGSKQGLFGSLFMGLTVGIVAAPCIGPFVLSLLTYVAAQGDPLMGFLMFFILSMGLGLPFLFLGTFSGSITNLPRSGEWMIWVKKVFGVVMVAVAIYFISTLIPEVMYVALLTAAAVFGGIYVGVLDKSKASFDWFKGVKSAIGAAMILFGGWFAFSSWAEAHAPQISWQAYEAKLVEEARQAGRPVLIDFYADWCIPCKQIDKNLFRDEAVIERAENYLALKADLTKENTERVANLRRQYEVYGVPTIIMLDPSGKEVRRFTDELVHFEPEKFVAIMNEVQAVNGKVQPEIQ